MEIKLTIRYQTGEHDCLCFTCAVKEANLGKKITTEIDDFSSEYDLRTLICGICGNYVENKE